MSDRQPHVLARSCAEPDLEFPTLGALVRELMALRYARPLNKDGGRPALRLKPAQLTRSHGLPGGQVIAVRLVDGHCGGHGSPLGYVFMPRQAGGGELETLRQALAAVMEPQDTKAVAA